MKNSILEKVKENPYLILTLPFNTMIRFICCVGKVDCELFTNLVDVAGEKYGVDFIAYSCNKQLNVYLTK